MCGVQESIRNPTRGRGLGMQWRVDLGSCWRTACLLGKALRRYVVIRTLVPYERRMTPNLDRRTMSAQKPHRRRRS